MQQLLAAVGLEPERIRMFNMSSAMAGQFVEAAVEMTATITEIGPNPLRQEAMEEALDEDSDEASTKSTAEVTQEIADEV